METSQKGVPQRCNALSPMLFNIYMSKLPLPPKDINIISYPDDMTLTTYYPQGEKLGDIITFYLNILHDQIKISYQLRNQLQLCSQAGARRRFFTHT